jgi:hypothetical protein
MRDGEYEAAWAIAERTLAERDPATRDDPSLPYHQRWVWDGRPLDGRDVLVRCYHGLGDTIQFARFLPLLRDRAASVTLEVQPRLACLFERFAGIDRLIPFDPARPASPSECDIEIMELDFALRARPDSVRVPYLRAAPALLPRGTIGFCHRAGEWDEERSIPPGLLAPGMTGPWISLAAEPSGLPLLNPEGCPFDMAATAALVAGAELVVTVDTMVAHLAGAMGKETWLLVKHEPDWRWSAETGRTAWYPTMLIYAQPKPGDWASVAARVGADLAARAPVWRAAR